MRHGAWQWCFPHGEFVAVCLISCLVICVMSIKTSHCLLGRIFFPFLCVNERSKQHTSVKTVTAFNDSWHFLLPACGLVPWSEGRRGTNTCCELNDSGKAKLGLFKHITHFQLTCVHSIFGILHYTDVYVNELKRNQNWKGADGCNCHHQ